MADVTVTQHFPTGEVSALQRYYDRQPLYVRIFRRLGLQAKLLVLSVTLIATILATYGYVVIEDTRRHQIADLNANAAETAASLAATTAALVEQNRLGPVETAAHNVIHANVELLYVSFYDASGVPLFGQTRSGPFSPEAAAPAQFEANAQPSPTASPVWSTHIVCSAPLQNAEGRTLGYVRVGVSTLSVLHRVQTMELMAAAVFAVFVLLSIPAAWLIVRGAFRPVRQFVKVIKKIGPDDVDSDLETRRRDIIGDLASAFNGMRMILRQQQVALKHANQQLYEANLELEQKIDQRTAQFETANRRLTMEIAEKEDFLRAVSHDLNAPLRNIAGMVTMLLIKRKATLDEDLLHRLDRIKKNVEIETDLINELLELSRIKTRRQAMENVELESLVWELRGMFENDLKTRDIELVIDTQLPTLFGERARLRQVFQNLIDNAIKYMGDGQPREIHVGCILRLSEAEFWVRDTGVGMDSEDVSKVFFVFRRGKNTATPNVPGKGVGLASVKSIVETYNGKIWVESELGKGTAFRFTVNGQFVPATGATAANAAKNFPATGPAPAEQSESPQSDKIPPRIAA